jgi:hypothetical protein
VQTQMSPGIVLYLEICVSCGHAAIVASGRYLRQLGSSLWRACLF